MNYAQYNNKPPYYNEEHKAYYDKGSGVPSLTPNNMTMQDIYRTPFLFLQEHRTNYKGMVDEAVKGIQTKSNLSILFFSEDNVRRIQRMIREEVYTRTKGQFKLEVDQELKDLFIVMRAIYLEHARHLPDQVVRQVKQLNKKVITEITPGIITEIKQYYGYLKEINGPLKPIARPLNVNNKGRKSLPSITTIWQ